MKFLLHLIQPFRFIARYHARQSIKRLHHAHIIKLEQEHQQEMLRMIVEGLRVMQESQLQQAQFHSDGLTKMAEALAQQAQGFGKWLDLFQQQQPCTTSVVREEDEYAEELRREFDIPEGLPPELQLAYILANDPNRLELDGD